MSEPRTAQHVDVRSAERSTEQGATEVSLLDLLNLVIRHRWRVARWMVLFGLIAVVPAYMRARSYTSTASFVLQGTDQGRAGLTGLAGQLGLQLSTGGSLSQSPQFYADLLRTRELLGRVADDSFRLDGQRGRAAPFVELFEIKGTTPAARRDAAIRRLNPSMLNVRVSKSTGMIGIDVSTPWPSVSQAIVRDLLEGVNRFSLMMRQAQAAAERRFSEERMEASRASLRVAEDRLAAFLQSNRQYQNSPELTFAHERLQREVGLQQQVFMSVVQGFEEARSREARNTPVITVVDSASFPTVPDGRGALPRFVVGLLVGGLLCLVVLFVKHSLLQERAHEPDVVRLRSALSDARYDLARWLPGRRGRAQREASDGARRADGR